MYKKIMLIFSVIIVMMFLTGCGSQSISEITANDDYVGKTVTVKGIAQAPIELGKLSGYTLVDSNDDKIIVATDKLPDAGDEVTVKGTLKEGIFGIGYYVDKN